MQQSINSIFYLLAACIGILTPVNAQSEWYAGFSGGIKSDFNSTGKVDNSSFSYESQYKDVAAMAGQFGLRLGVHLGHSNFWAESGLSLSGHAHDFRSIWGEKDFLGNKLNHRLVYYVMETPLLIEYRQNVSRSKTTVAGFLGGRINFAGFRPYWGESTPWNKATGFPLIQTVYFVPGSESQVRRYVITDGSGITPFGRSMVAVTGGLSVYHKLKDRLDFRVSLSYTYGTDVMSSEPIEVKTIYRDEFGVLVMDEPERIYFSNSKTTNLALDFAFLYSLRE